MLKFLAVLTSLTLVGSSNSPLATFGPDLAQARAIFRGAGERLWAGYGSAPSGMLLIAAGKETLICQADPPTSFTRQGRDPATGCDVFVRARSGLPDNLLAAMPVLGPQSTIVMGTPEASGFNRADWLRTILHEHFHQWQSSRPGYYARVDALDLKDGDTSGMWMLNFPFPYADQKAGTGYANVSIALADALEARGTPAFLPALDRYLAARHAFADAVGPRNWRYMEFQLWQEGGARWTEYAIAKSGAAAAREAALAGEARTLKRLRSPDLSKQGRDLAYTYGTAEIMLVDACGPSWRKMYPLTVQLGPIIEAAHARCAARWPARRSRV